MMDALPMLSTALLDRGFLVETVGQDIYLTDNAYLPDRKSRYRHFSEMDHDQADRELLETALEQLGLGGLKRNADTDRPFRLTAQDQRLASWQVETLFEARHVLRESGGNLWDERPSNFKRCVHGQKVSLSLLDAHVALLAKGLSAAGCTTYSACGGHEEQSAQGRRPLHVSLLGEGNTAWGMQLLADAHAAGIAIPDLHVQGDTLREHQSSLDSDRRDLGEVRRQAIVLGRYLYANRRRLRAERRSWAEHCQFPRPEKTALDADSKPTERQPLQFRIRLIDMDGYAIEFLVDNYRTLEAECRKALRAWWLLRRASAPAHVSIQAARMETPGEWKNPWGDPKPVWLKVSVVGAGKREWKILTRRRAKPKSNSVETSWLLLWMGIREALSKRG